MGAGTITTLPASTTHDQTTRSPQHRSLISQQVRWSNALFATVLVTVLRRSYRAVNREVT